MSEKNKWWKNGRHEVVFDKNAENIMDREEEKKWWGNRRLKGVVIYKNAEDIMDREEQMVNRRHEEMGFDKSATYNGHRRRKMVKKQETWKCGFWQECWEYPG